MGALADGLRKRGKLEEGLWAHRLIATTDYD
jgi:hypothetical protein